MDEVDRKKIADIDKRREDELRLMFANQHLWPARVLYLKKYSEVPGHWPSLGQVNRDGTFQRNFTGGNLASGEMREVVEPPTERTVDDLIAEGWVLD